MSGLPKGFGKLEPLLPQWAWAAEQERNDHRRGSTMAEINAFYKKLEPQMDAIMGYLQGQSLDQAPSDENLNLLYLALMFMEVSTSVEMYQEVDVPLAFPAERYPILSPAVSSYFSP